MFYTPRSLRALPALTFVVAATLVTSAPRAQQPASVSATVVPIQVTGDAASRFTLVVLADGYTAAEMPTFRANLDKHLNILWSLEPFRSYRNYFNVYAVEAVSPDSGINCDPGLLEEPNMDPELRKKLQTRTTMFGLNFGGGCTNINARGVTPAGPEFQARIREYAARATPNPDQILIIGNSRTYGGIGGGIATSTGGNALSPLITPHEIGHSLGRLTDEYTYGQRGVAGGTYRGNEPGNVHTTLLTEDEMKAQQKKWWRWLGEPSESGGIIGRFEGGSGNTKGIWRPSKHSMMISLGYYFDQVSREQMVRQISAKVGLIAASTPTDATVPRTDHIWIVAAHPVYHELTITWAVDDKPVANPKNLPYFATAGLPDGEHKVLVTVVDPTEFVRDPDIRSTVLTATKTWTVTSARVARSEPTLLNGIGNSTQAQRAVGAKDVVYIDAAAPKANEIPTLTLTTWRLDNNIVLDAANRLSFPLGARTLSPGTHTLSVTIGPPGSRDVRPPANQTRSWRIDNTMPTVAYTLATPLAQLASANGVEPHVFVRDEFTMKLEPKDDQPGYLVAEFRVNGDGWHHYYGWPDAPAGTPFKFTARGTNIKELIYGSLSSEGLSPQPWEPREPGWGAHRIEYRAKDAAGNIGDAKAFRATVMPSPKCTTTLTGTHVGDLRVSDGVTCLNGVNVAGNVTVAAGASVVATNAKITGTVTSTGATVVELVGTSIDGALKVTGTTDRVTIFGATIGQDATVADSKTPKAPLVIGNTIKGTLGCSGNSTAPSDGGSKNVAKTITGQCG